MGKLQSPCGVQGFTGTTLRYVCCCLVSVLLLAASTAAEEQRGIIAPKEKPKASAEAPDEKDAQAGIALSGHLSRDTAGPHELIRFWITVENRSGKPLSHVALQHMDIPGFVVARRCWSANQDDSTCYLGGEKSATYSASCGSASASLPDELCAELPPKQSITVWGDLEQGPLNERTSWGQYSDKLGAFAVVRWASDSFVSQGIVNLGTVRRFGRFRALWVKITDDWELGIPVWIGLFSGIYAWLKSRREKKDSEKAKAFEQQRATWNLLLLKVHRLAFQHYMPIVSTMQGVLLYFGRLEKKVGERELNLLGAFSYTLRLHWRVRKMKRSGASWYFKKLTAEELVVALFQAHRKSLGLGNLTRQATLDKLLDRFEDETTVDDVLTALRDCTEEETKFWRDFELWFARHNRSQKLILSALINVITFETNRPYYYWYEEQRPIGLSADELKEIRSVIAVSEYVEKDMAERFEEYLKEAQTPKLLNEETSRWWSRWWLRATGRSAAKAMQESS